MMPDANKNFAVVSAWYTFDVFHETGQANRNACAEE
jgi:hypothetical protein